jgi:maltose-binding protein MalE
MPVFDIGAKYLAAFQAGSAPDLLTIQHQQMDELAASGSVMPLNMEIDPALLIPGTVQAFSYKGDLYAIPYAYDNLALVTNPEYVAEIPPTWSELRSYAAEIAAGRESFTTFFITADGYHFYPIQSAFGGYIFGTFPDGTFNAQDLGLSSDGSLASATWLEETIAKQDVAWGEEDWALTAFQEQKTAIIMTGPWALERLREMGVPFQIHSFPREVQESQPFLSVYGFLENRNTQSPSVAQTFLKYLTTYEAVLAYSNVLRLPPARWDVLENLEDAELRAFGFAGANGSPIPYIPEMDAVWGPWTDAIQSIMIGYMSGYEAFTNAQEIILKEIGQ